MRRLTFVLKAVVLPFFLCVLLVVVLEKGVARASTLEVVVNYGDDWVAGVTDVADPGVTVVVTVTDSLGTLKADAVITAEPSGDFFVDCDDWFSGECPEIVPGDYVLAWAEGVKRVVQVGAITGVPDEVEETVSGVLGSEWFSGALDVRCEVWEASGPSPVDTTAGTAGGSFTCNFQSVNWDLQRGQTIVVRYYEPDGDSVINIAQWPRTVVNVARDSVGGRYAAGYTFAITVTDVAGVLKATAMVDSELMLDWWGRRFEGFEAAGEDWAPAPPDIQAYDIVHVSSGGYENTVQVGDIGLNLDINADQISGSILAPWLTDTLQVVCEPWGAWDSGMGWISPVYSTAEPDGSAAYICAWDPWENPWDIQVGQEVAVFYSEPDGDQVANVAVGAVDPGREDADADGVVDAEDNCVYTPNPGQEDMDGDGIGDVCDNCAGDYNPGQEDADMDGTGDACDVIDVAIDIKPGSDPNCTNNDGHGVIPVAILTTADFDAATVDPYTVSLDGAGARVKGSSTNAGSLEDVDADGDWDLVVQIEDMDGTYLPGVSVAKLTGMTYDGREIEGTDYICIVP